MFAIKKKRNGEVEFLWTFNPLLNLIDLFAFLDKLFSRKIFYLLPTGIGIGFGIGLVIFSQPASLNASNTSLSDNLKPISITIPSQGLKLVTENQNKFSLITTTWANHTVNFAGLSSSNEQFIVGTKNTDLTKFKLGDVIEVHASNQGIYAYQVYHTKEIETRNFNQLKAENNIGLILVQPTNLLGTAAYAVLAK